MKQYINKDALVAEIERRKQTWQHQDQQYVNGGKDVCDYLLGFLDTLEVNEVDLEEKACDAYCKVCGHYAHTTPNHICRQACDYYKNFIKYMKRK
jgi:hypothetical protein